MKFVVTEKKIQVSDEIKAYAEKKLSKLDKYFRSEAETYITYSMMRGRCCAEVTLHGGSTFFRVSESTGDMRAAIDSACASIERQIHKYKTRLSKRLRQGAFEQDEPDSGVVGGYEADEAGEAEESFEIVRTKRFDIKPMTPEEAVLQMKLLDHQFFVFKNAEDGDKYAVVYRRKDGGYGLIEDAYA